MIKKLLKTVKQALLLVLLTSLSIMLLGKGIDMILDTSYISSVMFILSSVLLSDHILDEASLLKAEIQYFSSKFKSKE